MPKILLNKSNIDLDYPVVRPSLDLDFTQEELDPRITFTRGTIGTRVNRNRLIETVDANQPRFDYDPVTGECKGLLIEEGRENLLTYSNDFSNPAWFIGTLLYSSNNVISPDGTQNASTFTANVITASLNYIYQSFTCSASTTYTFSFYVKLGTLPASSYKIAVYNNTASSFIAVDVTPTQILSTTSWTRVSYTFTTPVGCVSARVYPYRNNSLTQNNGTFYLWGTQLETGAFPTSYIPTTTSAVTRSADLAEITGNNFSNWYNQTEGTLYAAINNITTRSSLSFDAFVSIAGTDVNRNVIRIYTQTASGGGAQNKFLGAVAYSPDGSYVVDSLDINVGGPERIGKAILAYKKDNFAFTVNGLTPTRDIGGDIPTCNRLLIFGASRFQPAPSGTISRLTYYPRALKPNQLQYLTQ